MFFAGGAGDAEGLEEGVAGGDLAGEVVVVLACHVRVRRDGFGCSGSFGIGHVAIDEPVGDGLLGGGDGGGTTGIRTRVLDRINGIIRIF